MSQYFSKDLLSSNSSFLLNDSWQLYLRSDKDKQFPMFIKKKIYKVYNLY